MNGPVVAVVAGDVVDVVEGAAVVAVVDGEAVVAASSSPHALPISAITVAMASSDVNRE